MIAIRAQNDPKRTRRFHLGMAYLATGQDDKASNEFNKARTLAPKDAELGAKIDGALKSCPEKAKG